MPKPSPIERVIQEEQEFDRAADAAEQLAVFLGSALKVLGKEDGDDRSLDIPFSDEPDWSLDIIAPQTLVDNLPRCAANVPSPGCFTLGLWHSESDDIAAKTAVKYIERNGRWEVQDSLSSEQTAYSLDQIIRLTQLIVGGVKRYEKQNDITSPPDPSHKG